VSRLVLQLLHAGATVRTPGHATGGMAGTWQGVSQPAIRAAIELHQRGELTMGQLADGMGISRGWASRVVEELEIAAIVERGGDPADRRVIRVRLAASARDAVETAYRWRMEPIERALTGLDPGGRRAVRTFLSQLIDELTAPAGDGVGLRPIRA
jgi:DNA-binding MarR family transcriptional regulator